MTSTWLLVSFVFPLSPLDARLRVYILPPLCVYQRPRCGPTPYLVVPPSSCSSRSSPEVGMAILLVHTVSSLSLLHLSPRHRSNILESGSPCGTNTASQSSSRRRLHSSVCVTICLVLPQLSLFSILPLYVCSYYSLSSFHSLGYCPSSLRTLFYTFSRVLSFRLYGYTATPVVEPHFVVVFQFFSLGLLSLSPFMSGTDLSVPYTLSCSPSLVVFALFLR